LQTPQNWCTCSPRGPGHVAQITRCTDCNVTNNR